jgi:ABC-type branched-subunit amino acid transport system substrate-binding protein
MVYPDSGPLADAFSPIRDGVDARIGEINAHGGVNGRQISYVWRDDAGQPQVNLTAAKQLVGAEGVFGIMAFSAVMAGSADYLDKLDIPVTGMASEALWSKHDNMFAFSYVTGSAVDTYGRYVRANGGTRAVLVESATNGAIDDLGQKMVASMTAAGVAVEPAVSYSSATGSLQKVAEQIANSGANVLISLSDPGNFAQIVDATRKVGGNVKFALSLSGYDPTLLRQIGPLMAGITIPVFNQPFEAGGPAIDRYRAAMNEYSSSTAGTDREFSLLGYMGADMFLAGLEKAGSCPTRGSFIAGMHSLTSYDAGGLIPPMDIKDRFAKQTTCFSFVRVNDTGTSFESAGSACGKTLGN